jgi:hypothetical protein
MRGEHSIPIAEGDTFPPVLRDCSLVCPFAIVCADQLIDFIVFAGIPPTIVFAGTSLLTTAPAAMIEFSPTVTPGRTVTPAPIQTFLLM